MSKIQLRDYQKEAISEIEANIAFGGTEICLDACTSYGKTFTAAQFIKDQVEDGKSVVFMMNLTVLVQQTIDALKAMNIPFKVIAAEFDGKEFDHDAKVTIAMQQTLYARMFPPKLTQKEKSEGKIQRQPIPSPDCDVLMIDEFHISFRTPTMEDVKAKLNPHIIVGLSGSVMDEKGYALPDVDVIKTVGVAELTKQGFLSPLKVYSVEFAEEVDLTDGGAGEYTENFLTKKINTEGYIQGVVKTWKQIASDRKTIVFASSIAHSEALATEFKLNGIKANAYHSGLNKKDSKAIMSDFKNNISQVLVSMNKVLVGFDDPSITCGVACRPTKTRRVWVQASGRLIRILEGKKDAILIDCAQWTREHGFIEEPYDPPRKGDKQAMKQLQEKVQAPVIPTLLNGEDPTLMTRNMIVNKVKELEFKAKNVPQLNLTDLITLHSTSRDPYKIIEIAYEMNRRKTGQPYTIKSVEWVTKPWIAMINDFTEYTDRLLKTLRTMSKKKVVQGKKLNALHYTVLEDGWLRDQTPYVYAKQDNFKNEDEEEEAYNAYAHIDEDEIPF